MSFPPSHPAYRRRQGGGGARGGGVGGNANSRERYFSRLWRLQLDDPAMMQYFGEKVEARRVADALLQQEEGQTEHADEKAPLLGMDRDGVAVSKGSVTAKDGGGGVSSLQVAVNMIKCAVGAGSFGVPYAFFLEGFWAAVVTTLLLGVLSAHTICLLAAAEKHCVRASGTTKRFTYPEVARAIFPALTVCGVNLLEVLVYAGMCLSSIGVCAVYVVFILQTFPTVVPQATLMYMGLVLAPVMLGLALVRSYKYLALTSILGDIAVTAGICASIAFAFEYNGKPEVNPPYLKIAGVPQAASTLAFLFLIHAIVLPMAQSLQGDLYQPRKFEKVAWYSMSFITLLNLAFGCICFMLFRDEIQSNVIGNLSNGVVLQIVRVLLCVDLLFTVPMVLAFGREIIENSLFHMRCTREFAQRHSTLTRTLLRAVLVVAVIGTGVGMLLSGSGQKAFGDLIQLVGGVFSFLLGFILPPLFHLRIQQMEKKLTVFSILFHGFISLLGIVLLASSTYFTVLDLIAPATNSTAPNSTAPNCTSHNCTQPNATLYQGDKF